MSNLLYDLNKLGQKYPYYNEDKKIYIHANIFPTSYPKNLCFVFFCSKIFFIY